jgi:hypothetical protein
MKKRLADLEETLWEQYKKREFITALRDRRLTPKELDNLCI